jgi:predicted Zn finger-like uncharacterized protein
MNIACTACSARYGVADEKLFGKRVRITCKRCGTVLIVDGNTDPPTVSASTSMAPSPPASARPPDVKAPAPAREPPFMVAFADGRQEQADIAQIVRFHRAGQLGKDSVVWRDGMKDWADPWDVEEIASAFRRMGYARPTPVPAPEQGLHESNEDEATRVVDSNPRHEVPSFDDSDETHVVDSSRLASPEPLRDPRVASRPVAEDDDGPTQVGRGLATHATAAAREAQRARRVSTRPPRETTRNEPARHAREIQPRQARASARPREGRPSERPAENMFPRHSAGNDSERTAEPALGPGYELDIPKLTGARNESSVLFSLDSLLKPEHKPARAARAPRRDESFLVDSGESLQMGHGRAPALSAPDFTAPVSAPPPPPMAAPSLIADYETPRSSRAWLYVVVLVAFGGGGALGWTTGVLPRLLAKTGILPAPAPEVTTPSPAAPPPSAVPSAEPAPAPSAEPAASASASASPSTPSTAPSPAPRPTATGPAALAPRPTATATSTEGTTATSRPTATATATASEPRETPSPAPTTAGGSEPFDTAAAKEALSAAAGNVSTCKEMGGPVGNGRVSITFAPSGRPTSVAVTGDLAGTTVGSCIARLFRTTRVPAFSGDPVTVAKGFSVQ